MTTTGAREAEGAVARMSVPTLTAMVVGGMVGAGNSSLPARFGVATGILGSLTTRAIAGTGMLNAGLRLPDARDPGPLVGGLGLWTGKIVL